MAEYGTPSLEQQWNRLRHFFKEQFGKKPDMNSILFLIGVQELGKGAKNFTKEEKQDLMHIATCKILSYAGYYKLEFLDDNGWPHWTLIKSLPAFDLLHQEKLLKIHILEYFEKEVGIEL